MAPSALMEELEQTRQDVSILKTDKIRLEAEIKRAHLEIKKLKDQLFGRSSEKIRPEDNQLLLLEQSLPEVTTPVVEEQAEPAEPKKKRLPRHPLPEEIETVIVRIEPEEKLCPHCGREKCCIGEEKTEELDFIPAKFIKRQIIRPKLACPCGEAGVVIAPLPPRLIEKGRPGAGLLAQVVLSKYVDHLPLYRQQQIFGRLGINLSRQVLTNWVEQAALWLQPVYNLLKADLLAGDYLQVDETPVKVLDPEVVGKAAQGYLWVAARPGGDVLFRFDPSRSRAAAQQLVENFQGYLQRDGYGVYQSLVKDNPGLKPVACWAHVRRKFFEAREEEPSIALWFLEQIGKLYRIEKQAREENLAPPERMALREANAPPILELIYQRLISLRADPSILPESNLGRALKYALGEWPHLGTYLDNGLLEIDQNLCENSLRPTTLGKKNWLFFGHPQAAWRSAVIYSIVLSCQRRGIDPWKYLLDLFTRLPAMKSSELPSLLPANWKPASQ